MTAQNSIIETNKKYTGQVLVMRWGKINTYRFPASAFQYSNNMSNVNLKFVP